MSNLPVLLEKAETGLMEVLPESMQTEAHVKRVIRLAKMAIHKNPKIASTDPVSVIESIMTATRVGLLIDDPLGGAHLVPFGRKTQFIADYRGLIRLALRSGGIKKLVARVVLEGEAFRLIQGTNDAIHHEPFLDGERGEAKVRGFYAVAKLKTDETVFEYMTLAEVEAIRQQSKAKNNGPWVTHYEQMGKKTVVKRLIKWLDLSPLVGEAIEHDNRFDGFSGGTSDSDTPSQVAEDMAERARESQERLRDQLGAGDEDEEEGTGDEE